MARTMEDIWRAKTFKLRAKAERLEGQRNQLHEDYEALDKKLKAADFQYDELKKAVNACMETEGCQHGGIEQCELLELHKSTEVGTVDDGDGGNPNYGKTRDRSMYVGAEQRMGERWKELYIGDPRIDELKAMVREALAELKKAVKEAGYDEPGIVYRDIKKRLAEMHEPNAPVIDDEPVVLTVCGRCKVSYKYEAANPHTCGVF